MRFRSQLVPLPGSTKHNYPRGVLRNDVPEGEFTVRVMVRPQGESPSNDAFKPRARERKFLTRAEHEKFLGASPEDMKKVEEFASESGLRIVSSNAAQRTILLTGTAAALTEAFHVQLVTSVINQRTYRARKGVIQVPESLRDVITSVTGFDDRPCAKPHFCITRREPKPVSATAGRVPATPSHSLARAASAAAVALARTETIPKGYTPPQIAALYDFPKTLDGTGQTIAIIELGGGYRPEELKSYFDKIGIKVPSVTDASYDNGGANSPGQDPFDPNNADVEVMLDLQVAGSVAPGAKLVVYFAPGAGDSDFLGVLSAAIHDTKNNPNIVSISWGGPEEEMTQQFKAEFDRLLQSAAQLGITVCAASGDAGSADFASDDPYWDGQPHVDFPASDPFVLACGGTQITASDGKVSDEVVWYEGPNAGSGGGVSTFFNIPDYQKLAGVPKATMRGVPDVAGNAAQESGYNILCDGQQFPDPTRGVPPVGGTSAVAPLWAGLIACINQAMGAPIGFVNPILYGIDPKGGALRDVTKGNNGAYSATAGWDACTGLGVPDGQKLVDALKGTAALVPTSPAPVTAPGGGSECEPRPGTSSSDAWPAPNDRRL